MKRSPPKPMSPGIGHASLHRIARGLCGDDQHQEPDRQARDNQRKENFGNLFVARRLKTLWGVLHEKPLSRRLRRVEVCGESWQDASRTSAREVVKADRVGRVIEAFAVTAAEVSLF